MDTEILKHPDCPFDVIIRDGHALLRYKRTQSLEPANPQLVLMALLIKELTASSTQAVQPVEPGQELTPSLVVEEPVITEKPKTLK